MHAHFAPGARASYSDTNYRLLGKIIEAATGKPLDVVYQEVLFAPLGLKHTWLVGRREEASTPALPPADVFIGERDITRIRSHQSYWADGGIVSTVEDMIKFL